MEQETKKSKTDQIIGGQIIVPQSQHGNPNMLCYLAGYFKQPTVILVSTSEDLRLVKEKIRETLPLTRVTIGFESNIQHGFETNLKVDECDIVIGKIQELNRILNEEHVYERLVLAKQLKRFKLVLLFNVVDDVQCAPFVVSYLITSTNSLKATVISLSRKQEQVADHFCGPVLNKHHWSKPMGPIRRN